MTITDYRNFDLLITRSGDRYRAFVVDAPGGDASTTFDLPFTPEELVWLDGLTGIRRGIEGDERRIIGGGDSQPKMASLSDLGQRLFQAIFRDDVAAVLTASLTTTAQERTGLRLRLRFEQDAADLAVLPWEILYDPTHQHFLALGEDSPVLRYLSLPRSRSALLVKPPLRVLAVLSSPSDLPTLDMDREWQAIQQALAELEEAGTFVLERLDRPSLAALQERLLGDSVHILHFVGHGVFDEASSVGCLVLEDAQDKANLVKGEQLATVLRSHTHLRLVYLNACEGALASGQSVFTGVAQTLVKEGVPAAVAMQAEITDSGAIELARTFYTALAAGRPVDAALSQARVALARSDSQEWAIPVLFSRSPDNQLFDIREALPTPECPYPGMTPFTEAQQDLFFGRKKEIADAVERLRQYPFLAVIGPSGSGKSSLVYAGIIPALRKSRRFGPGAWTVLTMRPGQHPRTILADLLPEPVEDRTLLFVDQFEELFTQADGKEAQGFLDALKSLIGRPNLFILLTVRADFYPDLMASSLWQPIQANRLELPPLGDDELWAAIVEPAAQVGVTVDEALAVQLIADAAGQSGVLPLVQETLLLLWEKVELRELKLAAYRQMAESGRSGIQVAINRRAEIVYNNLPEEVKPIARRIFLRLIQFGEGRADTRRQQTLADLQARGDDPAFFDTTLATLTESRLLTTSGEEGSLTRQVDIAHEVLIDGWNRLRNWIADEREDIRFRFQVEEAAKAWQINGERGDYLWSGLRLKIAETWSIRMGEHLNQVEYRFLSESRKKAQRMRAMQYSAIGILVVLASILPVQWTQNWLLRRSAFSDVAVFSAGTVMLGSENPSDKRTFPPREVWVNGFSIDKFEVSYRQYRLCMQAGVCTHPREPAGHQDFDDIETSDGNLPVVWVDAYQASAYCRWLGGRLPTETEWERAAHGTSFRPFPWGARPPEPTDVNMFLTDYPEWALVTTVPVDESAYKTGATPDGIMHMLGNVSEWTSTTDACKEDAYSCQGDWDGESEVITAYIRGGSWNSDLVSLAYYDSADPLLVNDSIGFRCAW